MWLAKKILLLHIVPPASTAYSGFSCVSVLDDASQLKAAT